jgi:3',5'-cyclic-AMP phosphodiesterase
MPMARIYLLLIIFLGSCRFSHSPYEVGPLDLSQNEVAIRRIQDQETGSQDNFKVAFIADTHNYYSDLSDLVQTINQRGPYRFVIVAGDITNLGLYEEYKQTRRYLNKLNSPYLVAVGNHDLLSNGKKVYQKFFGERDFTLNYKDAEFILFDNNNWESGGAIPNVMFVEAKLLASSAPHKILVAHVSPTDEERFTPGEIKQWRELMERYQVKYFMHGHNHSPNESTWGNTKLITIGAPSKRAFVELIFSNGEVTHQKISF